MLRESLSPVYTSCKCKCDTNLMSQLWFFAANYSLQTSTFCIAFTYAGSMNEASLIAVENNG